eukprot:4546553-Prymnesium_polylepis.1
MHVNAEDIDAGRPTIDYFLPGLRMEDVLVDMATRNDLDSLSHSTAFEPGRRVIIRSQDCSKEGVIVGPRVHVEEGDLSYPVLPDGESKEA